MFKFERVDNDTNVYHNNVYLGSATLKGNTLIQTTSFYKNEHVADIKNFKNTHEMMEYFRGLVNEKKS